MTRARCVAAQGAWAGGQAGVSGLVGRLKCRGVGARAQPPPNLTHPPTPHSHPPTRAQGAASQPLFQLAAHSKPTCALSFSPTVPGLLATASTDKKARRPFFCSFFLVALHPSSCYSLFVLLPFHRLAAPFACTSPPHLARYSKAHRLAACPLAARPAVSPPPTPPPPPHTHLRSSCGAWVWALRSSWQHRTSRWVGGWAGW